MTEPSAPLERSQYHHYIPRFILRNYTHLNEQPTDTSAAKKRHKRNGKSARTSLHSSEPLLYGINLSGEEPEITETTVANTFGLMDMYRDSGVHTKQHHIEEQLSMLESQASQIICIIRRVFDTGDTSVWITRAQRDTLRKFLFIMKYRGTGHHKRYCYENAEDYNEDDHEQMKAYMKEKGFKRPIDVWFDNIKGILDLKMDYKMEWIGKIMKRIYPDDAKWVINNIQQFSLALVTPIEADSEFLLTQNAYSIYEGATTESFNPITERMELTAYTEFHLLAPISPRLLIVLRTFILPVPEEDSNEENRTMRQEWYNVAVSPHLNPEAAGSLLRDLPIGKARNSYSIITDGRVVPINGGPKGTSDKFCFSFFPLPEDYVHKINRIMLDESHHVDLIVFNSKAATYKTLAHYIASHAALHMTFLHSLPRLAESKATLAQTIRKLQSAMKLLAPEIPVPVMSVPVPTPVQELTDT